MEDFGIGSNINDDTVDLLLDDNDTWLTDEQATFMNPPHHDIEENDQVGVAEGSEVYQRTDGTLYWCPNVDDDVRIGINHVFESLQAAQDGYKRYAKAAGFDIRLSNIKRNKKSVITNRYFLCNKEGKSVVKDTDSIDLASGDHKSRNSNLKRTGCKVEMKVKIIEGTNRYVVSKFVEQHNHPLVAKDDMKLLNSNRKRQYIDFRKLYNAASASIGAAKYHTLETATRVGYAYMNASAVDYKNARREMAKYVGNKDAQMLVNLMEKRRTKVPDFFFDYYTVDKELQAIFWADEIARLNYKEFGDTISFDGTYRFNDHAMIFIPFIGIDNHQKSVVVGATLVCNENDINFTWLLEAFLRAHGKQPKFVITDQCLAMKCAIPKVFTESNHILCMWHIMKKLPNKIGKTLDEDRTFKRRFNKLVWNTHITPVVFENQWKDIIDDYDLGGNDWLNDMYEIRESWIPSYYVADPMSGLMKTTSRSENSHAFFRLFAHYRNDLVKFLHAFDCSIEKQRNKQRCLEYATRYTLPRCRTPLSIERRASEIFTRTVFFEVRKEITKAIYFCAIEHNESFAGTKQYLVSHKTKPEITKAVYKVIEEDQRLACDCNFFLRNGYPCPHLFKVLLNKGADTIPDYLICRRWSRDLVPVEMQAACARYGEVDVDKENLINGLYTEVDLLISGIRNDKTKMKICINTVKRMRTDFNVDGIASDPITDRNEALLECYGVEPPKTIDILPPTGVRNKGCGTNKRMKSSKEKAVIESNKPKRRCKNCHAMAHHDSRNCPQLKLKSAST